VKDELQPPCDETRGPWTIRQLSLASPISEVAALCANRELTRRLFRLRKNGGISERRPGEISERGSGAPAPKPMLEESNFSHNQQGVQ
jgi:hypothetical protein